MREPSRRTAPQHAAEPVMEPVRQRDSSQPALAKRPGVYIPRRSPLRGWGYAKSALVRWNRAYQVTDGMRWNHYRSHGIRLSEISLVETHRMRTGSAAMEGLNLCASARHPAQHARTGWSLFVARAPQESRHAEGNARSQHAEEPRTHGAGIGMDAGAWEAAGSRHATSMRMPWAGARTTQEPGARADAARSGMPAGTARACATIEAPGICHVQQIAGAIPETPAAAPAGRGGAGIMPRGAREAAHARPGHHALTGARAHFALRPAAPVRGETPAPGMAMARAEAAPRSEPAPAPRTHAQRDAALRAVGTAAAIPEKASDGRAPARAAAPRRVPMPAHHDRNTVRMPSSEIILMPGAARQKTGTAQLMGRPAGAPAAPQSLKMEPETIFRAMPATQHPIAPPRVRARAEDGRTGLEPRVLRRRYAQLVTASAADALPPQ